MICSTCELLSIVLWERVRAVREHLFCVLCAVVASCDDVLYEA